MQEITEMSFEEAFAELEATVNRLERGDLSLEDSITLFERGQALATHCGQRLDAAELKVRQLSPDRPFGDAQDRPFGDAPLALASRASEDKPFELPGE